MALRFLLLFIAVVIVSGCANLNSIYRTHKVRGGEVAFVDAKQRAVLANRVRTYEKHEKSNGDVIWKKSGVLARYCTEPSPDVFSVLSSSFAASGNIAFTPDTKDAAAKVASQISEAGSTISRTQTIQTLREMMYRLCERYLNDAIGKEEFAIQAARDHRIIVSILAIEQLTNATRPSPQAIAASASANIETKIPEIAKEISKQQTELVKEESAAAEASASEKKSEEELKKAEKAHTDAINEQKALLDRTGDKKPTDEQKKTAQEKVDAAAAALNKSQATLKEKQTAAKTASAKVATRKEAIEALQKAMKDASSLFASGQTKIEIDTDCCKVPKSVATEVANAIQSIVTQNMEFDDIGLMCAQIIGDRNSQDSAKNFCTQHFQAQAARAKAREAAAKAAIARSELQETTLNRRKREINRLYDAGKIEEAERLEETTIESVFGTPPDLDRALDGR